jgi:phytoene dehydrogenase-like protein
LPRRRAVVIGSGPNGLAAAITLAEAGLEVEVHEAAGAIGGGARTEELTLPGYLHDVCSAVHPLARSSPFFRRLELEIEWIESPAAVAHPLEGGESVFLERSIEATAAGLGPDGAAYRRLVGPLVDAWKEVEPVGVGPYPPSPGALVALGRALGPATLAASLRATFAAARPLAESLFGGEAARAFLAGHAAHAVLPLERRPSGGFGLALCLLGHVAGWPIPRGGAQRIADALAGRLRELGGEIRTSSPVDDLPLAELVLADVVPRELVRIAGDRLPARYRHALLRYRHAPGAFKVDWALSAPIPWRDPSVLRAATVHVGASLSEIAASERAPWEGRVSEKPFVLLSQPTLFDGTRAPEGRHTAWAYCHVPNGFTGDVAASVEAQIERYAPGFREVVLARSVMRPAELERHNRNLVGGDVNGGAMDLPQLLCRPVRRLVPYRTPVPGLFLCSAATPPGGGVHGMCGFAAALAALGGFRQ